MRKYIVFMFLLSLFGCSFPKQVELIEKIIKNPEYLKEIWDDSTQIAPYYSLELKSGSFETLKNKLNRDFFEKKYEIIENRYGPSYTTDPLTKQDRYNGYKKIYMKIENPITKCKIVCQFIKFDSLGYWQLQWIR